MMDRYDVALTLVALVAVLAALVAIATRLGVVL